MIVRNEETWLPGCLESVRGAVDEMVVVDTGSTDNTLEIALSFGAKVYSFPWQDDFAAARNESLRHAQGDWVLQLDADERLTPPSRAALRAALQRDDFDCGLLRLHDTTHESAPWEEVVRGVARQHPPVALARLMRRTADLRYRGRVHECVTDWLLEGQRTARTLDVDLIHLGAVPEVRARLKKQTRNTTLLQRRCEEEPDHPLPWGYLSLELLHSGDVEGARTAAERGWVALRLGRHKALAQRLMVVRSTLALGDSNPERALETLALGDALDGTTADSCHLRGCAHEMLAFRAPPGSSARASALRSALDAYARATAFDPQQAQTTFVDGSWGWASFLRAGALHLSMGALDKAEGCLAAARERNAGHPLVAVGLAELALRRGNCTLALQQVEAGLTEGPDGWTVAAEAAHALGALNDGLQFLSRAQAQSERGFFARHRAERWMALASAWTAYHGTPEPGPGVMGCVAALLANRPAPPLDIAPNARLAQEPAVDAFLSNLPRTAGQRLLVHLLRPEAEAALPGIGERVRRTQTPGERITAPLTSGA